jgi:hypothetical protein
MPYYKDIKLLFIHIPKTGGTSLEYYLQKKSPQTLYSLFNKNNVLFEKFNLKTSSLHHLTYKEILEYKDMLDVDFNENLKIVTIVRNPYHRIISDLFFWAIIDETSTMQEVYEIIKNYINRNIYDNHNKPQYEFIIDNNNCIIPNITIFKTENLIENVKNYGYHDFNFNVNVNRKNVTKDNYDKYLNNDSIKLINEFYKKDFELFNYDMKNCV